VNQILDEIVLAKLSEDHSIDTAAQVHVFDGRIDDKAMSRVRRRDSTSTGALAPGVRGSGLQDLESGMTSSHEAIIVGLGAMGSAVAYHLARRGCKVLGFDRFHPPHTQGSSHGETRIIREAYFEHPLYVPMVQRAFELWVELEQGSRAVLYRQTGGVMIGAAESELVTGALRSAREHGLAHELIDAAEIRERFPVLQPANDMVGVLEFRAGILFPERCVAMHLERAREAGADLNFNEPVLTWEARGNGVRVFTGRGEYDAHQLIATTGPWVSGLFPELALPFAIERQILYWFEAQGTADLFDPERCPIHLWQFDGRHFFYGFPDLGQGVKVARHHDGQMTTPDLADRDVSANEVEDIRDLVRRFVPGADGPLRMSAVCLYTNTPDEHFWIDRHPAHPQVLIVSACSGHGFKFASVIGEVVADSLVGGRSRFDLSLFRARFV
jgi:sarcosine oxidase